MVDVTSQVKDIQIFEDLFSPFITATLVLRESLDLINLFPFSGQEYAYIKATTPTLENGNLEMVFYIYKLTNREMMGDRSMAYVLHLISQEALVDINKKTSKPFQGKISDLARFMIEDKNDGLETKKAAIIEETVNGIKYISNFWSPLKNLSYLSNIAVNISQSPSYTFFENRDGFNFVSLESLYIKPVYQEFIFDNYNRPTLPDGQVLRDVNEEFKRIKSINIPQAFDYIDRATHGMYGSTMVGIDINTKKYYFKNYTMLDDFKSEQSLNEFPLASQTDIFRPLASLMKSNRAFGTHNGYSDNTNSVYRQRRASLLQRGNSSQINVVVPGRLDYTVGQKVRVNLNKTEPISVNELDYRDKMFSGNYIITALNHNINRSQHECSMELSKDSTEMDLNGTKQ